MSGSSAASSSCPNDPSFILVPRWERGRHPSARDDAPEAEPSELHRRSRIERMRFPLLLLLFYFSLHPADNARDVLFVQRLQMELSAAALKMDPVDLSFRYSLSRSSGINSQNILIFFFAQSCLSKSIIHGWSTIWVRRVCLYNQLSSIKRESVSRMRFFPIMSCTQLGASSLVTPTYFRVLQSVPLSASLSFWHGIINSTFTL